LNNPPSSRSPDVRAALDAVVSEGLAPGIHYLAVDANGVIVEDRAGWADLADRRPLGAGTTMMAYSMSKPVTAAAILQLVERGAVALDGPIAKYIQSPYGDRITVRHLLAHTSGIPNPIPLRWVHPLSSQASFDEDAALNAVLAKHRRLSFEPGTRYAYSNIGYWLLGRIVEQATGESFSSYVERHVLTALGIDPSTLGYAVADPALHATGYLERFSFMNAIKRLVIDRALIGQYTGRWLEIRAHYVNGPSFGGLVGTARGFGVLLRDQLSPHSRLFADRTRELYFEAQRNARGRPLPMTLGWHIGAASGGPVFYKEGGGGGFHCLMRLYAGARFATVVMSNATGLNVHRLADRVDALVPRR
jgi:D-alanyl-D-alanine carboxypeptidase